MLYTSVLLFWQNFCKLKNEMNREKWNRKNRNSANEMNRDIRFIVWLLYSDSIISLFSYVELKMMVESKLVSSIFKEEQLKTTKVIRWLTSLGKFILRNDSDTNGRVSDFKRCKNYMSLLYPTKETFLVISFVSFSFFGCC